ncbi:unnamed protein product [Closterium sp. Naga37s-1]|nr:unnamed protein product [Closterium sp. Naga37s-1]
MLAHASDSERRQLESFYPELRSGTDDFDEVPMDGDDLATIDLDDPPLFFLHVGRDWLEADVTTSTNSIDFGLIGCQLSSADFVGLREVPHAAASADLPSADLHLQPPTSAAKSASAAAAAAAAASRRPRAFLSSLLVPSAKLAGGAATRKSASGSAAAALAGGTNGVARTRHSVPDGGERHGARDTGRAQKTGEGNGVALNGGKGGFGEREEQSGGRRGTWTCGENQGKAVGGWSERGLRTWEILWKDSRWDGPMRRLTFSCNASGYKAIESKISEWAAAAHSTAIMIDASKAAIRARSSSSASASSLSSSTAPHRPSTGGTAVAAGAAGTSRARAANGGVSRGRGLGLRGMLRSPSDGAVSERGAVGMRMGASQEGVGGEAVPSGESTVGGWAVFYGSLPANDVAAIAMPPHAEQPRDAAEEQAQGRAREQEEEKVEDVRRGAEEQQAAAVQGVGSERGERPCGAGELLVEGGCARMPGGGGEEPTVCEGEKAAKEVDSGAVQENGMSEEGLRGIEPAKGGSSSGEEREGGNGEEVVAKEEEVREVAEEGGEEEKDEVEEEEEDEECSVIRWGSVAVEGRFLPSRDAPSQLLSDGNCKAVSASSCLVAFSPTLLLHNDFNQRTSLSMSRRPTQPLPVLCLLPKTCFSMCIGASTSPSHCAPQSPQLAVALPARLRTARWTLLYSTARDGISLATLYRKVAKKGPSLLIVRDSRKHVFGCFTSEEWKASTRYYGNGECFAFQVRPRLMAFRWTRVNALFMLSSANSLALGGG